MATKSDYRNLCYNYGRLLMEWMDVIGTVRFLSCVHCLMLGKNPDFKKFGEDSHAIKELRRQHKARYGDEYSRQLDDLVNALGVAQNARNELAHGVGNQYSLTAVIRWSASSLSPDCKKTVRAVALKLKDDFRDDAFAFSLMKTMADFADDNPPPVESAVLEISRLVAVHKPPILAVAPLLKEYARLVHPQAFAEVKR